MKRVPNIRDIYKGIRKPGAPPTRIEGDRREQIRRKEDVREIEKHKGDRKRGGSNGED
jgi:hypothetical protein